MNTRNLTLAVALALPFSVPAFAQLMTPATGLLLQDYQNWFLDDPTNPAGNPNGFKIYSDATVPGQPSPVAGLPAAGNPWNSVVVSGGAGWTGWTYPVFSGTTPNFPGPVVNSDPLKNLFVEVVFLGETAGWTQNSFSFVTYTPGGSGNLLTNVQAPNLPQGEVFGSNYVITLTPGQSLDFVFTTQGGSTFYLFDTQPNTPAGRLALGGFGVLTPNGTVRNLNSVPGALSPFFVVGLEDIHGTRANPLSGFGDRDANDFIFAFRTTFDRPQDVVPEPSTYGLMGVAALLGLIGYRRFKARKS
jgi:hypothetical protein